MVRCLLVCATFVSILACGPKAGAPTASPAQATAKMHEGVPEDSTSQSYAKKLTGLDIQNIVPEDTGVLKLKYIALEFRTDGSWSADATMTDSFDEATPCTESGPWTMEPAESATEATLTWSVSVTNCIGRSAGGEARAKFVIGKGGKVDIFNR